MILLNDKSDSSFVKQVSDTRRLYNSYRTYIVWGIINLLAAFALYLERFYGTFLLSFDLAFPRLRFQTLGFVLECLLLLNFSYYVIKCLTIKFRKPLVVSDAIRKMCRIADDEPGFTQTSSSTPPVQNVIQLDRQTPEYSPSHYATYLSMNTSQKVNNDSYPLNNSIDSSFGHYLQNLYGQHDSSNGVMNLSDSQVPFLNNSFSPNTSFKSLNRSYDDAINDVHSLKSFLKEQSENELRCRNMEMALENRNLSSRPYSYLPYNFPHQQHSPIRCHQYSPPHSPLSSSLPTGQLGLVDPYLYNMDGTSRYFSHKYQLACPVQPLNVSHASNLSSDINFDSYEVWSNLNVSLDLVDLWTERLIKYMSGTILNRVVDEIRSLNGLLARAGHEEIQIGYISLTTLKQLMAAKPHLESHLSTILPFLEISTNQEYLVQRMKDLSSGGGLSAFKWNGGGEVKDKKWDESLPTDAALLMHCLCCYMDSRLPCSHPNFSDGKSFTNQHLIRNANKINTSELNDGLYLLESSVHPPHYNVLYNGAMDQIKKGRCNLFHAILLFFYYIKSKEHGILRRMSLGMSGINILWIFDK